VFVLPTVQASGSFCDQPVRSDILVRGAGGRGAYRQCCSLAAASHQGQQPFLVNTRRAWRSAVLDTAKALQHSAAAQPPEGKRVLLRPLRYAAYDSLFSLSSSPPVAKLPMPLDLPRILMQGLCKQNPGGKCSNSSMMCFNRNSPAAACQHMQVSWMLEFPRRT
jgi:hypothetical protein